MTAYEMRISDCSSDVCSSDLHRIGRLAVATVGHQHAAEQLLPFGNQFRRQLFAHAIQRRTRFGVVAALVVEFGELQIGMTDPLRVRCGRGQVAVRSEEHTSELQSLMRISYAVFCLKKKQN